jgi:hypothetical protein
MKPVTNLKIRSIISLLLIFSTSFVHGKKPRDFIIPLTTTIAENPSTISFNWGTIPGPNQFTIWRKNKNSSGWGNIYAQLPADTTGFTDNHVETGVEYEYSILKKADDLNSIRTYVNAGIKCREVEYRGKVILLVDSTFTNELKSELSSFEKDLIGDGWDIFRKDISRNASVKHVKSVIRDLYYSDTASMKALILIGHIPVPYSGCEAYDGHPEHFGAWSADIYYGDMNEKIWTDESANCTGARRAENHNVPGDGKFDVTSLPYDEKISLQVGRIDFYNLPSFPETESELLKKYLKKDHNFRHKIIDPKLQALVSDDFYGTTDGAFSISGWRNFTALFNSPNVRKGFYIADMKKESFICSYGCGAGSFNSCGGVGLTSDFVKHSMRTVFTFLLGSYFGDWDSEDNFMRSALASDGWILTCMWAGIPLYTFHQLGMGETIGYCLQSTQNNVNTYDQHTSRRNVQLSMQGDPTLRMHIVCPASSFQSAITSKNTVLLSWKPADDTIIGYYIYKLDTIENRYHKISPTPVTDTWFEDKAPVNGNNYYMLKSYKLCEVASGSYYNLSQGIFDTIRYITESPVAVSGITLSVNPGNRLPLKIFSPFTVDATVSPENATNKLLKWTIENKTGNGRFDVNGAVFPEKPGVLELTAEALDGSGIKGNLEITVDSIPDPAGTITGEEKLCVGRKRIFYDVPEIRGATSYIWTLPNGVIDTTVINQLLIVSDSNFVSGNIAVRGNNIYSNGIESKLSVTIYEIPPKPMVTLIGNELHSDAPSGNQWYFNNIMIPNATDRICIPDQEGKYFVVVTLNGCPSYTSNMIYHVPTEVESIKNNRSVTLYPNPNKGHFMVSLGTDAVRQVTIQVFTLRGNLIYSEIFQNIVKEEIKLDGLPGGMYFVKVIADNINYNGKVCLE